MKEMQLLERLCSEKDLMVRHESTESGSIFTISPPTDVEVYLNGEIVGDQLSMEIFNATTGKILETLNCQLSTPDSALNEFNLMLDTFNLITETLEIVDDDVPADNLNITEIVQTINEVKIACAALGSRLNSLVDRLNSENADAISLKVRLTGYAAQLYSLNLDLQNYIEMEILPEKATTNRDAFIQTENLLQESLNYIDSLLYLLSKGKVLDTKPIQQLREQISMKLIEKS